MLSNKDELVEKLLPYVKSGTIQFIPLDDDSIDVIMHGKLFVNKKNNKPTDVK